MKELRQIRAGLIGNPNCGKTSIFNSLTGLNQHVGNFPGITVDKKTGIVKLPNSTYIELLDFPGCYSLYPNSGDEKVVVEVLSNPANPDYPDFIIYVVDATDMDRQFLLASQIRDLGLPILLIITMKDLADERGMEIDLTKIEEEFGFPVLFYSNITRENLELIREYLFAFRTMLLPSKKESRITSKRKWIRNPVPRKEDVCQCAQQEYCRIHDKAFRHLDQLFKDKSFQPYYPLRDKEKKLAGHFREKLKVKTYYQALIQLHHVEWLGHMDESIRKEITEAKQSQGFNSISLQIEETLERYRRFTPVINDAVKRSPVSGKPTITDRIDRIITHRFLGPVIFFVIMFLIFQAIFSWAAYPMEIIEIGFSELSNWTSSVLPGGWLTDLLVEGVIAGISGVMVFIPQIFFLFLMIGIMEEIGYMSRVVYMFDRIMQRFGLNGRSLVSLISGGACAIPAIMSARTISQRKERLITIMVTPLISCSARIPVYTILIGFAVPDARVGIFNARGLAFMGLYMLGIVMAFLAAWVMKRLIKTEGRSYLMLSLPEYKQPILKNIAYFVREKVGAFILEAGKIILLISVILWGLATYGPEEKMVQAERSALSTAMEKGLDERQTSNLVASRKIEASYAGHLGKFIEPLISPLGFDWKIGIALITSFAAREVFVGTMATIYSIGSDSHESSVKHRMSEEINYETGEKMYTPATSWSLLIFYVFALQCISTLAITKKETRSWKWPVIQFLYLGILAYLSSFTVFQLLS